MTKTSAKAAPREASAPDQTQLLQILERLARNVERIARAAERLVQAAARPSAAQEGEQPLLPQAEMPEPQGEVVSVMMVDDGEE